MIFSKRFSALTYFCIFTASILVYSCQKSDDLPDLEISHIRFINVVKDTVIANRSNLRAGVDFYVSALNAQDQLVNVNPLLQRQATSQYIDVLSNNLRVTAKRAFTDSLLVMDTVGLAKDGYYSFYVGRIPTRRISQRDSVVNLISRDTLNSPNSGNAKIRFAFLSHDMPNVTVSATLLRGGKDSTLYTNGRFRTITPFRELPAQAVIFQFSAANNEKRVVDTVDLQIGKIYTYTVYDGWSPVLGQPPAFNIVETVNK